MKKDLDSRQNEVSTKILRIKLSNKFRHAKYCHKINTLQ